MNFYDAVNSRRSVRDFTDETIPEDTLKRIIEAAYKAPANDHFRDWHYIIVTDPEIKREMLEGIPKNLTVKDVDRMTFISDPVQKESYRLAVPKQYRMLYRTAAVIIPLISMFLCVLLLLRLLNTTQFPSVPTYSTSPISSRVFSLFFIAPALTLVIVCNLLMV